VRPGCHTHEPGLEALDRPRLVEVEREPLGLALDDVGEHDGLEHVVLGEALRGGRAVEPGADDGDLSVPGHQDVNSSSLLMIASAYWLVPTAVGSSRVGFMS